MQNNNHESLIKNIGVIALGLIIAALLLNMMTGGNPGFGYQMHMGGGLNGGYGIDYLLISILVLAAKLLFFGLLIGFIFAIGLMVKRYIDFYGINVPGPNFTPQKCEKCGTVLHSSWKCCPVCGPDKQ